MTEQPPAGGSWTTCERADQHTWHAIQGQVDTYCIGLRGDDYYQDRNNSSIVTNLD